MRVARIRLQRFRGFDAADIAAPGHLAIVGEPRSGRSDLIGALRRVLDPHSTSGRVNPLDIHRSSSSSDEEDPLTEVEVSLLDLGADLEQLLSGHLELLDPLTGLVADEDTAKEAVLGVRLCYRARYDEASDTGDHWVDWPGHSDPKSGTFQRVRRIEREALPFLVVKGGAPLQVRAEGALRALMEERDPDELADAVKDLEIDVAKATETFSASSVVTDGIAQVLTSGASDLLGLDDPARIAFAPDDGSTAGLLRALQPTLELDDAGFLPIASHGSSASAILAASEAAVAAKNASDGLVIAIDDFGDSLDASSAEYLSIRLRREAEQVWLSTRRPDVLRAFEPEEILRLTRHGGDRGQHRLAATTDRKVRRARRDLLEQLLSAVSARTVVLMEGPHDVEGYGTLAARYAKSKKSGLPILAARSTRLVCAPGESGGKDTLPQLAALAGDLGFAVRAVVDDDKPGENDELFNQLEPLTEQLVILPARTAVEAALVRGLEAPALRTALEALAEAYALDIDVDAIADDDLESTILKKKILKMKGGLHKTWVESLSKTPPPPIAHDVLKTVCSDAKGRVILDHAG